jgi:hypothetical protein
MACMKTMRPTKDSEEELELRVSLLGIEPTGLGSPLYSCDRSAGQRCSCTMSSNLAVGGDEISCAAENVATPSDFSLLPVTAQSSSESGGTATAGLLDPQ